MYRSILFNIFGRNHEEGEPFNFFEGFRTTGIRILYSLKSGWYVCEYVSQLLINTVIFPVGHEAMIKKELFQSNGNYYSRVTS